jgi:hypothetical protein
MGTNQALHTAYPGKSHTLRGIRPEIYRKNPEDVQNMKEYKDLTGFKKDIETAAYACYRAHHVCNTQHRNILDSLVPQGFVLESATAQVTPSDAVKYTSRPHSRTGMSHQPPSISSGRASLTTPRHTSSLRNSFENTTSSSR